MKKLFIGIFIIQQFLLVDLANASDIRFYQAYNEPKKSDQLDLNDLGFTSTEIKGDQKEQEVLNTRAKKLQTHTYLGIATLLLALATTVTASEHQESSTAHMGLGIATFATYSAAAYMSLSAPEIPSSEKGKGWNVKLHKSLMFVHMPLMILTPLAGIKANRDYKLGEEPSGLGKYKKNFANALVGSLAAAGLVMTIDF